MLTTDNDIINSIEIIQTKELQISIDFILLGTSTILRSPRPSDKNRFNNRYHHRTCAIEQVFHAFYTQDLDPHKGKWHIGIWILISDLLVF